MIEAHVRVQAGRRDRGRKNPRQQGVGQREHGIHRIGGRTPIALCKSERGHILFHSLDEHVLKTSEIDRRGLALNAQQLTVVFSAGHPLDNAL